MAGTLTEPRPIPGRPWTPFTPVRGDLEPLKTPWHGPERSFNEVVASRRSAVGAPVSWPDVGNLLWHLTRQTGPSGTGRAGVPFERRAPPSAGGLHPFHFVCLMADEVGAKLYERSSHGFSRLLTGPELAHTLNAAAVRAVTGDHVGCTVRFIADAGMVEAAYDDAESLLLREAGCLLAFTCLFAEQLELAACPLGFLGQDIVAPLGFDPDRFVSLGGVLLSR